MADTEPLTPDAVRALHDPARSGDKREGLIVCAKPGCPGAQQVYRVNPKGERGVFMCAEHAAATDAWEARS